MLFRSLCPAHHAFLALPHTVTNPLPHAFPTSFVALCISLSNFALRLTNTPVPILDARADCPHGILKDGGTYYHPT